MREDKVKTRDERETGKENKRSDLVLRYLRPHLFWYILGAILVSSQSVLQSLLSGELYRIVIRLSEHKELGKTLGQFGVLVIALIGVSGIVMAGYQIYMRACLRTDTDIRKDLLHHVCHMFQKDWTKESIGYWAGIFSRDLDTTSQSYKKKWTQMMSNVITIVVSEVILLMQSPIYAVVFTGMGLLYFVCGYSMKGRLKEIQKKHAASLTEGSKVLSEMMLGLSVLRFYQMEEHFDEKYTKIVHENEALGNQMAKIQTLHSFLNNFGYSFMYVGSLIAGLMLCAGGKMDLADMMYLWSIGNQMSWNMQNFGQNILSYQENKAGIERMERALNLEEEADNGNEIREQSSDIEINNVSFGYTREKEILHHITVTIKQGEKVAIVGGSGSGKTTLVKLLMNLYSPEEGAIKVGGTKTTEAGTKALRQRFAYLPQSPFLFDDTIENNLRLVKKDAGEEEIQEASRKAGLSRLVENLPDGIQTEVGEDGAKLSGGERQRVGVARCFLRGGDVFIMDEMTSALDARLEEEIINSLYSMEEKTVICITHKLSAARMADRILFLQDGTIVEDGSHEELMGMKGQYYRMVNT